MRKDLQARIYARALFQVARREDQVAPWGDQLLRLRGLVAGVRALTVFFSSPNIPAPAREKMIAEISSRSEFAPEMENFLRLIVRKHRIKLLGRIAAIYTDLADEYFNRVKVSVESPIPLEREEKERLEGILASAWEKTIQADYLSRPELIAGLLVRAGERVYDASLRGQLDRMKERLLS